MKSCPDFHVENKVSVWSTRTLYTVLIVNKGEGGEGRKERRERRKRNEERKVGKEGSGREGRKRKGFKEGGYEGREGGREGDRRGDVRETKLALITYQCMWCCPPAGTLQDKSS